MSILSTVTSVASGGMTTVYKYLAIGGVILALAVGSFFYGDHVGSMKEKNAVLTQATKQEAKVITITKNQTVIDTTAVDTLQKQLDAANSTNAQLQAKIGKTVSRTLTVITPATQNAAATCELSTDWIAIYNQSLE